jgi:hypothetical protein
MLREPEFPEQNEYDRTKRVMQGGEKSKNTVVTKECVAAM